MYNNYIICNEYFLENIAHVHIILYVSLIKVTLKIKKNNCYCFEITCGTKICSQIFLKPKKNIKKNTYQWKKCAIIIDKREIMKNNFIYALPFFTLRNSKEQKLISYWDLIRNVGIFVNRQTSHKFSFGSVLLQ